ncbi:hypothetical protein ACFE04_022547 [Oxalis oulophora]
MPLFITDNELSSLSNNASGVADKADAYIRQLNAELETVIAQSEAERITSEQTCSLIEHKYVSLSNEYESLHDEKSQLQSSLDERLAELADVKAQNRQLHLQSIEKDGELEKLAMEVSEQHKSKRQLIELVEQKDWEISEKNVTIKSYLDKIVNLTEKAAQKESRCSEIETELTRAQAASTRLSQELCSIKDSAAVNEDRLSAELSTVNKLVELYKESSEEWSRKAGELEGVIKALETHTMQSENDYKERLEKEVSTRKQLEDETADLKEKLQRCEGEIESIKKLKEQSLLPLSSFTSERWIESLGSGETEDSRMAVSKVPVGVSGTALAASLLRDGWSLVKLYAKYQEAVDAYRHEQLGRKEAESVLQRVLAELEEKAGVIMDERADQERMFNAYTMINEKMQLSISEQAQLEKYIQELKAIIRRHERDNSLAQKEIVDLQHQVTILLKECRDIQLRSGSTHEYTDDRTIAAIEFNAESDAEHVISERLLTFKDINGLVEQNVKLRSLVRSLSDQIECKETTFKEKFELEIKKHTEEASSKVAAVLQRAEEQGNMIEALHSSVAMYKRLYEEEHNLNLASSRPSDIATENGRADLLRLVEGSQEASKRAQEKAAERVKYLEADYEKSRSMIVALRSERDKFSLEANFSREKLDGVMKEVEHQRDEINGVLTRNVEFSQLIIDHQRKLRESAESLTVAEDLSRKLSMEVSMLKREKELLSNAEKRACDEVHSLSERVHRLQASLDIIQSSDGVREEARAAERRKQEEYIKQLERDWAEARKELQEERASVRMLRLDREQNLKNSMRQVEEIGKELANALHGVTVAETRAAITEAKLQDLEKINSSGAKVIEMEGGSGPSSRVAIEAVEPHSAKEELAKLRKEAQANEEHMLQYKSIAEVNEAALKQMESAHESFKIEAEKQKEALEAELFSLRERVSELENEYVTKSNELASAATEKEDALKNVFADITKLKEEICLKSTQIASMEVHFSALREDLEKEQEKWRAAQANYERQVLLQSETIQELTKTSQALALLQAEASELRKLADTHKSENDQLKAKWAEERSVLENSQKEAEKKFNEVNEQNKTLLNRLEAWHIQSAEKDRNSAGVTAGSSDPGQYADSGLQDVISYLRRSKDIAETEISLLKQESLRLKTQLESALKEAETAHVSLNTERANSRALMFTDEEIKKLQLQVSEINLLRESNIQLREENKYNFEECQKLREITENAKTEVNKLESLVREKETEVEASKKEIEMHRLEKENLDQKISELLERCKNVDVENYARLKKDVHHTEQTLKEKNAHIEELESLVSKKQNTMAQLEQDIANSRSVISENEKQMNEIAQREANFKTEIDRQKRLLVQLKRRNETISKEKEEISKENQSLLKQLEKLKQAKRSGGDISIDQIMKDQEEKDQRIQSLEKAVERLRVQLAKEKDKRNNTEKAITDSVENVTQAKNKAFMELEKHKQALKRLSDELEKLKQTASSFPEGTSLVQLLSGSTTDDLATAFISAVENFEKVALSISSELGASLLEPLVADASQPAVSAPIVVSAPSTTVPPPQSVGPTIMHQPPAKTTERKESLKATNENRRKIIRPQLVKQPHGDVEMSETVQSQDNEPSDVALPQTQPLVRKRPAVPSCSDMTNEETTQSQGESNTDMAAPASKKLKGSDSTSVIEEPSDAGVDLTRDLNEESVESEKEVDDVPVEKVNSKVSEQTIDFDEVEQQTENNAEEANVDKTIGTDVEFDDGPRDSKSGKEDKQPSTMEEDEREEGELEADDEDVEGDITDDVEVSGTPEASPARIDDDEGDFPEVTNDEKDDENEENAEGLDKSNDGGDHDTTESDQSPEATNMETSTLTKTDVQDDSNKARSETPQNAEAADDVKQPSPVRGSTSTLVNFQNTIVNIQDRARQRAALRQAGGLLPETSTVRGRGTGRPAARGRVRGGRVIRGGRGPAPGQQG